MKRTIAMTLAVVMLTAVFSLCVPYLDFSQNPFKYFDDARRDSIISSMGAVPKGDSLTDTVTDMGYVVKFKDSVSLSDIYACVENYSFKLLAESKNRLFKLVIDDLSDFKKAYGDMVYDIEEEGTLRLSATVDDPLAAEQWELEYLDAYTAWDTTTGSNDVTVAVLDSGVYRMHPDFEGVTILAGYDAVDRVNVINVDHNGHGTKVISILAAAADNGQGMAGVGRNISILPVRVSDSSGYIHSADFIEAVYYAADAGADVINMSFGGYSYSAMEEAAMEYASSKGCLLVSAAGNNESVADYAGMKAYPASYSSVISVGAVDEDGVLCPFSHRNSDVDMVAPGFNVTVADTEDGYVKELGTSFASAYVSAVAALAFSAIDEGVRFTSDQFVSLVASLNGGKRDDGYGYGAVNAADIVSAINTPLISGIAEGGVYHKNVTVTFNRGTAILDGKPFYSGESVITSGSHSLVVTDKDNELTVNFITDNIPLKYNYTVNSNSAVISFSRGTATLDGAPYLSGTEIKTEGRHFFKLTGPYGNVETFDFKCDFNAPTVFGVENGGFYTSPVYITAERGGTLTLNGKIIPSGTVVSKSGAYTLVSSTADGKSKNAFYFTLSLSKVSLRNAAVTGANLIADELNKTIILYNSALSGVRVFAWGNTSQTKCFIRTESGVTAYGFTKSHLVLIHSDGITLCDRSAIASGNTSDVINYSFKQNTVAAFFNNGFVYYLTKNGSVCAINRMDVSNGKTTVLTSLNKAVDFLCGDGNKIIAATRDGEIFVYNLSGELVSEGSTGTAIKDMVADSGYICTDSFVYRTENMEKIFAIRSGEKLIFAKNGVLVTNHSVYDLKKNSVIASFGDAFTDAFVTDGGYVFKTLNSAKIEIINSEGDKFSPQTAAQMLNAASCTDFSFGEAFEVSSYESNAIIPEGSDIIAAVLPDNSKVLFAISSSKRALLSINCNSLQLTGQTVLRYEPNSMCTDGKSIYVSFKNEGLIYRYSISDGHGEYYTVYDRFIKLECADGKLFALNTKGNLYAFSTENLAARAETVIKSQNVISFSYCKGYLYVYLKPVSVSMLYKINADDYSIAESAVINANADRIFTASNVVFVGNKAYNLADLKTVYTVNGQVRFAYEKYFFTESGLYRSADGSMVSECRVGLSTPIFAKDYSYYSIEADHITRIRNIRSDLDSLPEISGISNGAVLDGPITVNWSFGKAYIDGTLYDANTPIENGGLHSFVVSLPFGLTAEVQFTINADINYIVLSAQKNVLRVNESTTLTVNAHPFTYGVVDVVYSTDNDNAVVLPDGSVIGAAVGNCTITATTTDGEHTAIVKITITEGFIDFDSSYFFADRNARIVKGIAAGTDVETFLISASQTKGNLVVRGYNDVEITAGMIHTGMKAELYDIFGGIIDTWQLSVLGDIDGDGFITANDYHTLDKFISHPDSFTPTLTAAADIDSNGVVNAFDLLALKEHLLRQNIIGDGIIAPSRVSNATAHIVMPKSLVAGTSFTATVTLTDMKGISAISGTLMLDSSILTLKEITVIGKDGGFYTQTPDGVFFFADVDTSAETTVVLLAVFTVSEYAEVESTVSIKCTDLCVYDGSAAALTSVTKSVNTASTATPEVLIHNQPDYIFDGNVFENRLVFPASTQQIYVSAYPMENSDIAGDTVFGNRTSISFATVFSDADGNIKQYNFECEKSEASPPSPGTNEIYKNSNTFLSSLTTSVGTLSPAFDKNIRDYYLITDDPDAVVIEAVPESKLSAVNISEYDEETGTVTVKCTAEDGSAESYTVHLHKEPPVSYKQETEKGFSPWLWCLPIIALLVGAATFYLYKRPVKTKNNDD